MAVTNRNCIHEKYKQIIFTERLLPFSSESLILRSVFCLKT